MATQAPVPKKIVEYSMGNVLKTEYFVIDGKKNGKYIQHWDDQIFKECNYVNDKLEGEYKTYCLGKLGEDCNYVNDKIEGEFKKYYVGLDTIYEITNYSNGQKNGQEITYHENGQLFQTCNYINDKLHGELKQYDEHGNLTGIFNYVDGIRI